MLASGTFEQSQCTFSTSRMAVYATYFVKFLQAYQALGIPVWAVTTQNEPVSGTFMNLTQSQEQTFIGSHLGPALKAAHKAHTKAAQHLTEFRSLTSQTPAYQMASMAGGYVAQEMANYAQSVMLWNMALDQNGEPNQGAPAW